MDMTDDTQLLSRFARGGDEGAFCELVRRHLDLVYSAALRQLNGDVHLAQDVTQTVFTDLARKGRSLPRGLVLSGWLYEAARLAAAKAVWGERRRRFREQEAAAMHDPTPESTPDWEQLRPVLDTAIAELSATDRNAVLLRFFERKDFNAVGVALDLSEDAAQKRVARALDKLRAKLARRGITLSASALAVAITGGAIQSAPAGLAVSVATASLAGASAVATTGLAANLFQAMATMKLKLIAAAVVAAAVGTPLVVQHHANEALRAENAVLREHTNQLAELNQLREEKQRLIEEVKAEAARPQAEHEELLRLRGQVTSLRRAAQENVRLQTERDNLTLRLQKASNAVNPPPAEETPEKAEETPEKKLTKAKMNFASRWGAALRLFAEKNDGQFPRSLDEAAPFLQVVDATYPKEGERVRVAAVQYGARDDQFEIVWQGSLKELKRPPQNVIVMRERQPFRLENGHWARTYLFAGGHSEIASSTDGDFTAWEKERMSQ
jgi:RNA polymerase sigma factor (sigma-70 family)